MRKVTLVIWVVCMVSWTWAGWAAGGPEDDTVILKKREAVQTIMQMRMIEERTVQEDQELKQLHAQLKEKLRARLAEKQDYQRLKKNLDSLRRELHSAGTTLKPHEKFDGSSRCKPVETKTPTETGK